MKRYICASENLVKYCDTDEQVVAVQKIQRCASRLGFNIRLGTKIGKYPQTLILDHGYQDNAIYIHRNGSVEIGGVEIGDWSDEYFDPADISNKAISDAIKELMNTEG